MSAKPGCKRFRKNGCYENDFPKIGVTALKNGTGFLDSGKCGKDCKGWWARFFLPTSSEGMKR